MKHTKIYHITARFLLAAILLAVSWTSATAAETAVPYAHIENDELVFYYDGNITDTDWAIVNFQNPESRGWHESASSIAGVRFDDSFKSYAPTVASYWFYGMSQVQTIDLSEIDMSQLTEADGMFQNCTRLTTIYVNESWPAAEATVTPGGSTSSVTGVDMFNGCRSLVGGSNTAYDGQYTGYSYAHIDGGVDYPGYFTAKSTSVDPNFHIYICFGQSNMEGNAQWEAQDEGNVDSRFQMLATCDFTSPQRSMGNWYTAECPIVSPDGRLGPTDYFGRTMVANLPNNKIGVIAVAMGGSPIEAFDKDLYQQKIADNSNEWWALLAQRHYGGNPYGRIIEMAKKAQEVGVIKGILLHQGESNNADPNWPTMVKKIYEDMLTDLGLQAAEVPLFVGEMLYEDMGGGCYAHNTIIEKIPEVIPTGHVVSAKGLPGNNTDVWHFSAAGYRTFGKRYAKEALNVIYNVNPEIDDPYLAEPYAALDGTTLTFYYDGQKSSRNGMDLGPFQNADYRGWNSYAKNITKVVFDSSMDSYTGLTSTAFWFWDFTNLEEVVDIKYLHTDNVTSMESMFGIWGGTGSTPYTGKLPAVDMTHFNTSKVVNMNGVFSNCAALTALDLSSFDTSSVTDMSTMFSGCTGLMTIYVGSGWTMANVTSSSIMFQNCTSLVGGAGTTYDASHIDVSYARIDGGPNSQTPGYLTELIRKTLTPDDYFEWNGMGAGATKKSETPSRLCNYYIGQSAEVPYGDPNVSAYAYADLSAYDRLEITATAGTPRILLNRDAEDGYWNADESQSHQIESTQSGWSSKYFSHSGNVWTVDLKQIVADKGFAHLNAIKGDNWSAVTITKMELVKGIVESTSAEPYAVLSDNNTVLTFYYDDKKAANNGMDVGPFTASDQRPWDEYCSYTIYTPGIYTVVFDDSFAACTSLTSTAYWFASCTELTEIRGISNLKTPNVEDMSWMFFGVSLSSINVSGFNTDKLTNMEGMFSNVENIESLDLSNFNTSKVKRMGWMFRSCSKLHTIYVGSGWSTEAVEHSLYMFLDCTSLVGGAGTTFDANQIEHSYAHIDGGESNPGYFTQAATKVATPTFVWNGDQLTIATETEGADIYYSINRYSTEPTGSGTEDDPYNVIGAIQFISTLEAGKGTTEQVFIKGIVSYIEDEYTTESYYATYYISQNGLHKDDIKGYNLRYLDNQRYSSEDKQIQVGDEVVICGRVINFNGTSPQVIGNTGYLVSMTTPELTTKYESPITVSGNSVVRAKAILQGLSDSDVAVTAMSEATPEPYAVLSNNNTVLTFYYDDQKAARGGMDIGPFAYLEHGFGESQRPWHDVCESIVYAVIDPSMSQYTSLVSTGWWFYGCKNLKSVSGWENLYPLNIVDMWGTFEYCSSLPSDPAAGGPDFSNFKSTNLKRTVAMFHGCTSMTSLDLSAFNTSNVTENEGMFEGCSALTTIYVGSGWDMSKATENWVDNMFSGCTSLVGGAGTRYDANNIGTSYAHIDGGTSNPGYLTELIRKTLTPDDYFEWNDVGANATKKSETPFENCNYILGQATEVPYGDPDVRIAHYADLSAYDRLEVTATAGTPRILLNRDVEEGYWNQDESQSHMIESTQNGWSSKYFSQSGNVWTVDLKQIVGDKGFAHLNAIKGEGWTTGNITITKIELVKINSTATAGTATFDRNLGVLTVDGDLTMQQACEQAGGRQPIAERITSLIWNSSVVLTESDLDGFTNPNMLIFVGNKDKTTLTRNNVVIEGKARKVVLSDVASGNGDFWCPQEFFADSIIYTHNYKQATEIGVSRGWETLVLPFDVQTITHEKNGVIAPFGSSASDKHFWLRSLGNQGLERATQIEAYIPYIISMPNNGRYPAEYNLAGNVTFSSSDVTVGKQHLEQREYSTDNGRVVLIPVYNSFPASEYAYALNVGEARGGHPEGSVFEANYRGLQPFQAYLMHEGQNNPSRFISLDELMEGTTGIETIEQPQWSGAEQWWSIDGRKLNGKPSQKGVYIRNGKKVVVKATF